MPTVAYFLGIAVLMYHREHGPPHIHVVYQGYEALLRIDEGSVLGGKLPPMVMLIIKVRSIRRLGGFRLAIEFSDDSFGECDFSFIKTETGPMLEPLKDPAYFARVFVEDGALTWPNGYDG